MRITKYPRFRKVTCANCETEFILNKSDYRNGIHTHSQKPHKLYYKCPVCHEYTEIGAIETYKVIQEDLENIFKGTAEQVNSMPATETRHILAKEFNELYTKVQKYFEDKFGSEGGGNESI